jgi:uncharacterized membrane protein
MSERHLLAILLVFLACTLGVQFAEEFFMEVVFKPVVIAVWIVVMGMLIADVISSIKED